MLLATSPTPAFVPVSRDSAATEGLWCPQHPQAAELGVTGLINSKRSHPTGLPSLRSQHAPHDVIDFSLRKISFAYQAQERKFRVCKRYLGKGQGCTARASRQMVPPFFLDLTIFMIAWPGMHLFAVNKLSGHIQRLHLAQHVIHSQ